MKRIKTTSRLFEQVLGVVGSLLSLFSGSFFLLIGNLGLLGNSFTGTLAIIGAFLGFLSSFYVNKDLDYAGVGFIASAVLIFLGVSDWGFIGSVLLLFAGISALFRE